MRQLLSSSGRNTAAPCGCAAMVLLVFNPGAPLIRQREPWRANPVPRVSPMGVSQQMASPYLPGLDGSQHFGGPLKRAVMLVGDNDKSQKSVKKGEFKQGSSFLLEYSASLHANQSNSAMHLKATNLIFATEYKKRVVRTQELEKH